MDKEACGSLLRWAGAAALAMLVAVGGSSAARADAMYTIRDLGTLPGTTMSAATSINNAGQVVGVSYNSSDGTFVQNLPNSAFPPRFQQTGSGGQSFLYGNGQMTSINPIGGLALSINDSGQVVGGQFTSINASGQYVGAPGAGILTSNYYTGNPATSEIVSAGTAKPLPSLFTPFAINNAGQIVGMVEVGAGGRDPAIYQGGKVTDLASVLGGSTGNNQAIAVNQRGDVLDTVIGAGSAKMSLIYSTAARTVIANINSLPGGAGLIGAALNDKGQVVGNGFLYSNGTIQMLSNLIPPVSGWSNLNATGINEQGQIVGQGVIGGQEHGFLMTPAAEAPEPGTIAIWATLAAAGMLISRRRKQERVSEYAPRG